MFHLKAVDCVRKVRFGLTAIQLQYSAPMYCDTLSCQLQTHQTQISRFLISDFNRRLLSNSVLNLI